MTATTPIQQPLDVLMATTSYPRDAADWKGRFIHDLAASLDAGGQVSVALWGPSGALPGHVTSANSDSDSAWLAEMARRGGIAHLLRNSPIAGMRYANGILSRLRRACRRTHADLYHVNWLQLALGLPDDGRPAYVSVLGSDFALLRLPGMVGLLRHAFARRRTLLAPNADWMVPKLEASFGDVAEVRPNPFGVSRAWFDVEHRPAESPEWLVVSRVTRKKLGDLLEWGDGIFNGQRRLRLLGPKQETFDLPDWIVHEGHTNPDELRNHWFPRAAGLLTLSRHDEGRPQVMIEAMAAGLPVIASTIPAHKDLVRDGETGWLVTSPDELVDALSRAEQGSMRTDVGANARKWIHENIGTWDDCAARCISAYRDIVRQDQTHARA